MNTNAQVLQDAPRKPRLVRLCFILVALGAAALIAWLAWPSRSSDVSVTDLSRADGKPRFWATAYQKPNLSNLPLGQRLYMTWIIYRQHHGRKPAAYNFPPGQPQACSIAGLLNQCMEISGTNYLIAVEAVGGIVNFGHTNTLNGAQWVSAFEQAITNQPVGCYDYTEKRGFNDTLLLIRERPNLVKVVPRSKLPVYEQAGLVKAKSVEGTSK